MTAPSGIGGLPEQHRKGDLEGWAGHAPFRDDRLDVRRRRDVEGEVLHADPLGCHRRSEHLSHLPWIALLDGDVIAAGAAHVDGGQGRRDVERDLVFLGEDRHGVGADLVGHVSVGRDAVGSDDDQIDLAPAHELPG
jgi:hypothetical protein